MSKNNRMQQPYGYREQNKFTSETNMICDAISAGGSLGKSQYVKGKFIASDLCLVLTPNEQFKNEYPIGGIFSFISINGV